jgi:hypothetical protein
MVQSEASAVEVFCKAVCVGLDPGIGDFGVADFGVVDHRFHVCAPNVIVAGLLLLPDLRLSLG